VLRWKTKEKMKRKWEKEKGKKCVGGSERKTETERKFFE
jgi:hypothetical protein